MEQRIQQFHDETKTIPNPPTMKTVKQMNKLAKFIFKNQEYRFSDKEKNKLFACVEAYFTVFDRSGLAEKDPSFTSFPLLENVLKCTCFTTKQKSQQLKWYEEILAKQEDSDDDDTKKKVQENHHYNDDDDEENYDNFDWVAFEKEE